MKSFLLIIPFFLLITQIHYSQWTNQNPVPDGNDLWSTFFVEDSTGWIVGSEGFIKKTNNAGIDWIEQKSGTTLILKSVQFVDQNTGWICGEAGLILKTTDGGQNWFNQTSGTTEHLTNIHFYDADTGYVVGFSGTILKTTDGGSSWISLYSGTTIDLNSVDFVGAFIGYAVGGQAPTFTILKTTDSGTCWIEKSSGLLSLDGYLLAVDFIDANTGFVGGGDYRPDLFKTTDGGDTWIQSELSLPLKQNKRNPREQLSQYYIGGINFIYFKDTNNGWFLYRSLWDNFIYSTTDGGTTWELEKRAFDEPSLLSFFITQNGTGLAVGSYGLIYLKEESSPDWMRLFSGPQDDIYSFYFVDENSGWAAGSRWGNPNKAIVLKTTNGGKSWKTQLELYGGFDMVCIYFLNELFGWAVSAAFGSVHLTTDGGENWTSSSLLPPENLQLLFFPASLYFIDENIGWYTSQGWIRKSTDSGNTWIEKSSTGGFSVFFIDQNIGWVVGDDGILKSTDGGETWIIKSSLTASYVRFYDSNIGMCIGGSSLLVSTDGGETWTSKSGPSLQTINFINSTSLWGYSSEGTLYKTTNFGDNWDALNIGLGFGETAFFIDEYTGWFGGLNGTMFKYQNNVVPVELISFNAKVNNNTVHLNWETATEVNNSGFEIERRIDKEEWKNIGFVEGHGTTIEPIEYSYTDDISTVQATLLVYRLKQIDFDGSFEYSDEVSISNPALLTFELAQNYPNPFNPSTMIEFSLPEDVSNVKLSVYNALGEKVAELVNTALTAGKYQYQWNAQNVATGMYIYELRTDNFVSVKKMLLMK